MAQKPLSQTREIPSGGGENTPEFSVSELSSAIKRALEDQFGYVRLRGEVSGYRGPHASGHCYFGLKDEKAKIDAVVWRGVFAKLKVKPEEGMEVIAHGRVTSYPNASKYQIVVERIEPAGVGALMALLEERKKKLTAEGLFAQERKKQLPFLPSVVGIVTSPTGAVIRDMLAGFQERFPTRVVLWPVRVQGETSGGEVAQAIAGFNALPPSGAIPRPDVLIVARGGGSLEDLWGFNDEAVVRAAAASDIPLISAVGHETDWTLIDLAADARAPTPTKAAEWAVPKYAELNEQLTGLASRLAVVVRRQLDTAQTKLKAAVRGLPSRDSLLALPRQRFDGVVRHLSQALLTNTQMHQTRAAKITSRLHPRVLSGRISHSRERINVLAARHDQALKIMTKAQRQKLTGMSQLLRSLSYQNVLKRGFALVRAEDGRMVRSVAGACEAKQLDIEFQDGRAQFEMRHVRAEGLDELKDGVKPQIVKTAKDSQKTRSSAPGPKQRRKKGEQGNLF